ncbi:MAG TPA: nucleotidyltransferase domain-containing protein [Sphingomonas sp.]|nr:nucleotidyltransferase domain-containing protein [Sphingomonas sp.]
MIVLDGSQIRQLVDVEHVYRAYRDALRDREARFRGSLSWKTVRGHDYLYQKRSGLAKSLGPRSPETERIFDQFRTGRAESRKRVETLDKRLREMAPVNRAMRLGRVPVMSARVIRRLDGLGLIGQGLRVAGTHALYAYESLAAVHFDNQHVATQDIDLLYDARSTIRLVGQGEAGLIGQLQSLDRTFRLTEPGSFRAVNDDGFMVDLITPLPRNPGMAPASRGLGGAEDVRAVEIAGLRWLENSRPVDRIVLDERGYPLRIVAPDPRAFAVHKSWVAGRDDRDPGKRRRDLAQARAVASILAHQLPELRFDDPALQYLPADLRKTGEALTAEVVARRFRPTLDDEDWV